MALTQSTFRAPNYYSILKNSLKFTKTVDVQRAGEPVRNSLETTEQNLSSPEVADTTGAAIGAIGIGLEIGQGIGESVSAYMTAKATAASYMAQASISRDNALYAQFGVEQSFKQGEAQVAAIGYKQAETKARQRVAMAANGIAIGVGSSAEQLASTDISAEQDKLTAQQNALAQAWGYRRQRMMGLAQARGAELMASAYKSAGRVQMYGGLAATAIRAAGGAYSAFGR